MPEDTVRTTPVSIHPASIDYRILMIENRLNDLHALVDHFDQRREADHARVANLRTEFDRENGKRKAEIDLLSKAIDGQSKHTKANNESWIAIAEEIAAERRSVNIRINLVAALTVLIGFASLLHWAFL